MEGGKQEGAGAAAAEPNRSGVAIQPAKCEGGGGLVGPRARRSFIRQKCTAQLSHFVIAQSSQYV